VALRPQDRPFLPHHDGMHNGITELIRDADTGDRAAIDRLFTVMYADLHRLAEHQVARNGGQFTLGATTLLHEAYISMADREGAAYPDRAHFMAYASRAMRGLVIDYVRRRQAHKRGGEFHITGIDTSTPAAAPDGPEGLEALGDALEGLSLLDRPLAELVDLHFFCGFGFGEIAAMRGVSERTVQRDWQKARLLLRNTLRDEA
jgi:RNA polymerase sigma factor (TIGR02999 family)